MTYTHRFNFLDIPLDALTMKETISIIDDAIKSNSQISHVVLNAGKVVSMQSDQQLKQSVISCDIINADGQSIVWASRFLGFKIPERVAGADLMQALVLQSFIKKYKCFFLGGKEEIVKKVVSIYALQYGSDIIAGYRNGYFSLEEEELVAQEISNSGAQILFVAISSPKKENFMFNYRHILSNVNFTMGVGGTFDIIAGFTKRAPIWMQNCGLEFFYRFLQEPRRMWKRYLFGNSKFIFLIFKKKIDLLFFRPFRNSI
jgi:N-acetylglucosaminyldiphosphoundecaprenol N-acetyl-beta-D-mannosaminyltransferase